MRRTLFCFRYRGQVLIMNKKAGSMAINNVDSGEIYPCRLSAGLRVDDWVTYEIGANRLPVKVRKTAAVVKEPKPVKEEKVAPPPGPLSITDEELKDVVDVLDGKTAPTMVAVDPHKSIGFVSHWDAEANVGLVQNPLGQNYIISFGDLVNPPKRAVAVGMYVEYRPRPGLAAIAPAAAPAATAEDNSEAQLATVTHHAIAQITRVPEKTRGAVVGLIHAVDIVNNRVFTFTERHCTGDYPTVGRYVEVDFTAEAPAPPPGGKASGAGRRRVVQATHAHVRAHDLLLQSATGTLLWFDGVRGVINVPDVGDVTFSATDLGVTPTSFVPGTALEPFYTVRARIVRVPTPPAYEAELPLRARFAAMDVEILSPPPEAEVIDPEVHGTVLTRHVSEMTIQTTSSEQQHTLTVPTYTLTDAQRMAVYAGSDVTFKLALVGDMVTALQIVPKQLTPQQLQQGDLTFNASVVKAPRDGPSITIASSTHGAHEILKSSVANLSQIRVGHRVVAIGRRLALESGELNGIEVSGVVPHTTLVKGREAQVRRVIRLPSTVEHGRPKWEAVVAPLDGSLETTINLNRFTPSERALVKAGAFITYDVTSPVRTDGTTTLAAGEDLVTDIGSTKLTALATTKVLRQHITGELVKDCGRFGFLKAPPTKGKPDATVFVRLSKLPKDVQWRLRHGETATYSIAEMPGYPDRVEAVNVKLPEVSTITKSA
jgi:hypothetical protein